LSPVEKIGGGFKISGESFNGVSFHPEEKDYLIGVTDGGKAVLLKINQSDWTIEKEDEIDLEMGD
jgi:hypothetical protein